MGVTSREIAAAASAQGVPVTERQLERWRAFGLLSKGAQHGSGRGEGSYWIYPEESMERAIAIARLAEEGLSLPEIGIHLWLDGAPYDQLDLRKWLKSRQRWFERFLRSDPTTVARNFIDGLMRAPASERSKFNVQDGVGRYDNVYDGIKNVVASILDPSMPLEDIAIQTMLRGIALSAGEVERVKGYDIDLEHELRNVMPILATLAGAIDDATMEELEAAKDLAILMSSHVLRLRARSPEQNSEFAKTVISLDDKTPFRSSAGVLWSLGALRYAALTLGHDHVMENLRQAQELFRED